ncbi:helix-turn-helix domain-containing protein [Ktedonobacter sp. SOSP1-85]|uniref:helix-turn-helix domain-containing protein n=1 Tax=Ktedonobacter sp. SOSP1-85 TaxID=2778367 RepID=UPI001916BD80|nr:helix-turn-helix domain-containing protein [Ktedonobacter sp. SOSP1-85]
MTTTVEKTTTTRAIDRDRYYSLAQVGAFIGRSRYTIHRRVGAGVIPASKAGRAFIVKGSDVLEIIAQRA